MPLWTNEKTGVMSVQYAQYTLEYFLHSMKECGYKNIDFWAGAPHFCPEMFLSPKDAREELKKIKKRLQQLQLDVSCYTLEQIHYPVNLASNDKTHRKLSIGYFEEAMDYAKILETDKVFVTSGVGLRDLPRQESFEYSLDSLKQLVETAEKKDVFLVIEQLQPFETNLGVSIQDIQYIKEQISSDRLKVCVDVVAMAVAKETLDDCFTAFGEDLVLIHMSDGTPGGHFVPGDGHLDIKGYYADLEKHGFKGSVTLEINSTRYLDDPHAALMKTMDYLKKEIY